MSTNNSIQVRKVRDFGSAISDTFSLFFPNFMLFAKVFMKIIAPLLVVGALMVLIFALAAGSTDFVNLDQNTFPTAYVVILGILYFVLLFAMMYCVAKMMAVSYRFVKIKADDPEREISVADLMVDIREKTMPLLGRILLYALLFISITVVVGLLFFLLSQLIGPSAFLISFFLFPVYIYYAVATSMYLVTFYEEEISFVDSLKRSMYLVKNKWWLTLFTTMIIGLIVSLMMSFIQYIPLIFIGLGGALMPSAGTELSLFVGIAGIITMIFFVATLVLYFINFVFQSLWYYSLVEDKEGRSITNKINQIGESGGEPQYG